MKSFFLVVALAMFVSVQALTDAQKEKLREHARACVTESGVDNELVKNLRKGDYSNDDANLQKFSFCMMKKTGLMTDDGKFHKDVAMAKTEDDKKERVGKAIDACLSLTGSTHEETAWLLVKCYHNEKPDHEIF